MLISFHNSFSDVQLHTPFFVRRAPGFISTYRLFYPQAWAAFLAMTYSTYWYQFTLFGAHAIILQALFCSRGMDQGDDTGTHILSLGEVRCEVSVCVILV